MTRQPATPGSWWRSHVGTLYLVVGATMNGDGRAKVRVVRIDRNGVVQSQSLTPREWRTLATKGMPLDGPPDHPKVGEAEERARDVA